MPLRHLEIKIMDDDTWQDNKVYLYGIKLINHGYYWEAHEALERIWQKEESELSRLFLQGLIQVAAALLKHSTGNSPSAQRLYANAFSKLNVFQGIKYGMNVKNILNQLNQILNDQQKTAIKLTFIL